MSRWFRFYDDVLDDPKVQRLSPELFRTWVATLCLASKSKGKISQSMDDLAYRMRVSVQDAQSRMDELILAGLVDIMPDGSREPHNWHVRQSRSDTSKERMQKHRAAKKAKAELPSENDMKRHRDVTVTDIERIERKKGLTDLSSLEKESALRARPEGALRRPLQPKIEPSDIPPMPTVWRTVHRDDPDFPALLNNAFPAFKETIRKQGVLVVDETGFVFRKPVEVDQ
jgi:hypothetical protein